jgi:hypothetical protein
MVSKEFIIKITPPKADPQYQALEREHYAKRDLPL